MKKLTVNSGDRFNQLTVIEMTGVNSKGFSMAKCRCDCGNVVEAKIAELRVGRRKSCGCSTPQEISKRTAKEIIGKRFGRLLVQRDGGKDNRNYRLLWCLCDCGQKVKVRQASMLRGDVQSCGCFHRERLMLNIAKAQAANVTHGLAGSLSGRSWNSMIQRCYNPYGDHFRDYGGAGIKCCQGLSSSPLNLIAAIGDRPSIKMSLDRIENDGGYWCGQCAECVTKGWKLNIRWATGKEQCRNRHNNRYVEIDGITRTIAEWCELTGIPRTTFTRALDEGKNPMTNEKLKAD